MMRLRLIRPLALAAPVLLAGCISIGAEPPPSLLTLTAASTVAVGKPVTAAPGDTIGVTVPRATAALATTRVPVQSGNTELAYLKDAVWVETPNRLFARLLSETISARTGRVVVGSRAASFDSGLSLSGELQNFGLDADRMEVVVVYDAVLRRKGSEAVTARRFEARQPVGEAKPGPVGQALNRAANQVAEEVTAWIG